jgi:hypothetical protein
MKYRPDPRDPLTQRFRRSVLETVDDPWAYSEGAAEPDYVEVDRPDADGIVVRWCLVCAAAVALMALGGWL